MGNAKIIPAKPDGIFLPYQNAYICDNSTFIIVEKSRQTGFSWSAAYKADERCSAAGNRYDQWISSRDEIQARLFLEDCKLFAGVMELVAKDLGEKIIDTDGNTAFTLQFGNQKRIHSMSSNPDAQAGKRGSRLLDEFALHKDQRKLWAIAKPGITWGGSLEVISTHRGSKNFFNELIREIKEKGNPKKISLHTVTLQNALDQGFLYKLQKNLPHDHEVQDMDEAAYFDYTKASCADEESFLQEYMCVPGDDDAAFLEYDLIASCEYGKDEPWELALDESLRGRDLYAGLDIGRKNDLTVLWVVERLGDVLYTRKVLEMKNMSKPDQEDIIWPWLPYIRRACFDYTGLGIGWGDDAQKKFGKYAIELYTFSARVKEALAYPVRGKMQDTRLRIPYNPVIRADLRAVTKVAVGDNIRFTAERSAEGHADRFWALALAIQAASTPAAPLDGAEAAPRRHDRDRQTDGWDDWDEAAGFAGKGTW